MTAIPGGSQSQPEFLSEKFAQSLRQDKIEDIAQLSPYAACLLPLLDNLGWSSFSRELIEALPHFSDDFDIVELRNVLIRLGYGSETITTCADSVSSELYPCLFVSLQGEVRVLLERTGRQVRYFDAQSGFTVTGDISSEKGTAYVFTDTRSGHEVTALDSGQGNWFEYLLHRFKKMVWHLLAMTFIINLVALVVPLFVMVIYDKVIGSHSPETLPYLVVGVVVLLSGDLLLRSIRARVIGTVAARLDYLIGVETFRRLLYLPPMFTEQSTVAAQLSRLKQFDSVRDFFTGPNAAVALELPFVLLFISVIAMLAGYIALIPVAMVLIYIAFGSFWFPYVHAKVLRSGIARTNKQRIMMQSLEGRQEIKAIGGEGVWWERFREVSGEAVMANHQTFLANGMMHSLSQGLMTLSGVAVIAMGAHQVMAGQLTIGALIATMALVWRVLSPLQTTFLSFSKFQHTIKAMKQINQLMRLEIEQHSGQAGLMLSEIRGKIAVDRVSFRYAPGLDPALLGVSFSIEPGEMVAIIGSTGSGKSTLLKMIAGMYRPQAGSMSIDETDIRQINAMDLRSAIAYVPQDTRFFHGTIAQNLRLNNGLATQEDLECAARDAGVLDDILRLPKGFDSRIGDTTTARFPPGFMRGLSMARAFVIPAQILLLDEPGASLDDQSDRLFMQQIERLKGKRTIVMVSHRPSHIRMADRAVYLDQGAVQFVGPSDQAVELMLESQK